MRYTLLRMVQLILSSMDSDEVNSISDTVESLQVVDAIETAYNDMISTIDFPEHFDFFELEASGDITRPTLMTVPDDVAAIEWIQYDNSDSGDTDRDFKYVFPADRASFFDAMNGIDTADSDVYQFDYLVDTETFDVRGKNDLNPTCYTMVDNRTLLFDNFDSVIGQTLQGNRTHCYGQKIPVFTRSDSFTPDLEPRQFTLLFNEAKSQAFIDLKQVQNSRAEQKARRGWVHSQRKKPTTEAGSVRDSFTPNFGRGSRK